MKYLELYMTSAFFVLSVCMLTFCITYHLIPVLIYFIVILTIFLALYVLDGGKK